MGMTWLTAILEFDAPRDEVWAFANACTAVLGRKRLATPFPAEAYTEFYRVLHDRRTSREREEASSDEHGRPRDHHHVRHRHAAGTRLQSLGRPGSSEASDARGFFEIPLDVGHYSLCAVEDSSLYANRFGGQGEIYPVEVLPDSVIATRFDIMYRAAE